MSPQVLPWRAYRDHTLPRLWAGETDLAVFSSACVLECLMSEDI